MARCQMATQFWSNFFFLYSHIQTTNISSRFIKKIIGDAPLGLSFFLRPRRCGDPDAITPELVLPSSSLSVGAVRGDRACPLLHCTGIVNFISKEKEFYRAIFFIFSRLKSFFLWLIVTLPFLFFILLRTHFSFSFLLPMQMA